MPIQESDDESTEDKACSGCDSVLTAQSETVVMRVGNAIALASLLLLAVCPAGAANVQLTSIFTLPGRGVQLQKAVALAVAQANTLGWLPGSTLVLDARDAQGQDKIAAEQALNAVDVRSVMCVVCSPVWPAHGRL